MALTPGSRIGPYDVVSTLGAGGMGEVFRARDTRLQRDVALKILPDVFATDPERLARFQREAQVLASLNCQNIAAIYGLEESSSGKALVLELVEGPTLADRLESGPVPLDETIAIARQIVDALEAAHAQGIIHRDLKPANIKVRPDGTVKVLDFGLAKALDPVAAPAADALSSPTITARATQLGVILGTAAYMAPEQARGKPVDKRADVWAFGCLLYEMITGRRAFAGEDVSDTLAFVITKDPDWTALPVDVPASLRRLLRRCLEKDRKRRLADIADARLELDDAAIVEAAEVPVALAPTPARTRLLPWIVAGVMTAGSLVMLVLWGPWRAPTPRPPVRVSTHIGANASILVTGPAAGSGSSVVLSPQGDVLVVSAREDLGAPPSLWIRRLDELTARKLPGTEGAASPFFSPDGRSIAFFTGDGKLKRVAVDGGSLSTLATTPFARGGDWTEDDRIVFAPDRVGAALVALPASGGEPTPITTFGPNEATHRHPQMLPGGKALIYTAHVSTTGFDEANIVVKPLPDGAPQVVVRGGYYGRYVPSGHLLYVRAGALHAVAFDARTLHTTGQPVRVMDGVTAASVSGSAHVSVARNGTIVYLAGGEPDLSGPIAWMGRDGATSPLRPTPSVTANVRFAPDGRRLALDIYDGRQWDVWIYDWTRETLSRLTPEATIEQRPVWSLDGQRIVFNSRQAESDGLTYDLYWRRADGAGPVQRLTQGTNPKAPGGWHPSGRFFVFAERNPQTSWDLMIVPIAGDETSGWKVGTPTPFLAERAAELEPAFSPDGGFVAYQSDESGSHEIYVRPFPGPGGREQISSGGGTHPTWSPNRRELLYVDEARLMAVPYAIKDGRFVAEKTRPWSPAPFTPRAGPTNRSFDIHPDGERVAYAPLPVAETGARRDHVVLLFNFFDELRRLAPQGSPR